MKKFAVFSGFLGSGKTTTMIALTKFCNDRGIKSVIILYDLVSQSLADELGHESVAQDFSLEHIVKKEESFDMVS